MLLFVNLCEYLSPTLPIPDRTGLSPNVSIAVGKYDVTALVATAGWLQLHDFQVYLPPRFFSTMHACSSQSHKFAVTKIFQRQTALQNSIVHKILL